MENATNKHLLTPQVQLKGVYYPITLLKFDITKNKEALPYSYYVEMCKTFENTSQFNITEWQNLSSVFCFDLSCQDDEVFSQYPVNIHITKDTEFVAKCYCIILEEKKSKITIIDEKMSSIY